ncbi:Ubiquitin carboxyl-terminal hydrolase 2 [Penicillium canariense]|uniref:ubiquitinyl hydrolase 1 n=1 Tax=Penicillium canariense TaxID=189055 RepID=A0A9W9LMX7_9EURO|nr:Ubiquitin carboxyl-terminal hydrolase 2 [Penicillium canariense]KAJ5167319.1 Ubiquitin carboxyl-terminal hydrolase 2 [Penicillium canariense]
MADTGGWSTIESDEGLFTSLIETLGVQNVQFEELISLDANTIRSLGYSLLFLSIPTANQGTLPAVLGIANPPHLPQIRLRRHLPLQVDPRGSRCPRRSTPRRELRRNRSRKQRLLCRANDPKRLRHPSYPLRNPQPRQPPQPLPPITLGTELRSFKDFTTGFPPELRGEALSNSEAIRTAHNSFARASPFADETARPQDEENAADVYHFIAYTPVNGTLYELDGLQPHPISHGACDLSSFPEKVIEVLQRRIARYPPEETHFNLMAVVQDPRPRAREIGDAETLEREERKRAAWAWENTLRRWNFVGFIGEMMKGVAAMKEGQDESGKAYEEWVEAAKKATRKRLEMRR